MDVNGDHFSDKKALQSQAFNLVHCTIFSHFRSIREKRETELYESIWLKYRIFSQSAVLGLGMITMLLVFPQYNPYA